MRVLTDWFPATTKPVRDGLYLSRVDSDSTLMWMLPYRCGKWMASHGLFPLDYQDREWCGLAFDPVAAEECDDAESRDPTNPRRGWWVPQP